MDVYCRCLSCPLSLTSAAAIRCLHSLEAADAHASPQPHTACTPRPRRAVNILGTSHLSETCGDQNYTPRSRPTVTDHPDATDRPPHGPSHGPAFAPDHSRLPSADLHLASSSRTNSVPDDRRQARGQVRRARVTILVADSCAAEIRTPGAFASPPPSCWVAWVGGHPTRALHMAVSSRLP
jgi:hypothetical protein